MGYTIRQAKRAALVVGISLIGSTFATAAELPNPDPARDIAGDDRVAASLQLAQLASEPEAGAQQTLQIGTPPPPASGIPGSGQEQTLQIGAPPPPAPVMPGSGQEQTLQIGAPPAPKQGAGLQIGGPAPSMPAALTIAPPEPERVVSFSVPWLRAEAGGFSNHNARADFSGYLSGALRAIVRPEGLEAWSLQGTVRADATRQTGRFHDSTARLDYGESFVRYNDSRTRITLGAQTVLWGRVDEIPPTDQMSVQDISRFTLDELADRRRAVPALRIEHSFDALKLDALVMPWFRPAELPDTQSAWHPVRQEDGRILSIGNQLPLFNQAVRLGTIGKTDDFEDFGGAGVRASHSGRDFDAAITVQRTRRSLPYYEFDPAVRAAVLQGTPLDVAIANGSGPTFREVHPLMWVFGGDAAFEALGGTVRVEAAYLSDVPVTTLDARLETHDGLDWVAGYEFFPGDSNARVTLQIAGHHVFGAPATLERTHTYTMLGEVELPFAQERWIFNTRFALGLDERDIYLNPRISFVGWEPHEFYVGAHLFSGSQRSANGFFADNDSVVLGWRAKF